LLELSDQEFRHFQRFIFETAGISLSSAKKALVIGRLTRRIEEHKLPSFSAYFKLLADGRDPREVQTAVDLLTTNETYFFRQPRHFEVLRKYAVGQRAAPNRPFRIWSAACSSGEEVYSMAMVLEDCLGAGLWEVLGSDISTRVLSKAQRGHYAGGRTTQIPSEYLRRFCLRGIGEQDGTLLVDSYLRNRVRFLQINLNTALPAGLGTFDVIFLRNVLIYFDADTKRRVVGRVLGLLKAGGLFFIGQSETLNLVHEGVELLEPSVYRKA